MTALLVGYARVSTDGQDLTAQREGLQALGVPAARVYVDHGLTGTTRDRPGLRGAMAACREGETLVVTTLDRLARSLPDARSILEELTARQVRLGLGGSVRDPLDPVGRLLLDVLAMVAELEADLIRMRTREGVRVAKAKGRLHGRAPKLSARPGCRPSSRSLAGTAPRRSRPAVTCSSCSGPNGPGEHGRSHTAEVRHRGGDGSIDMLRDIIPGARRWLTTTYGRVTAAAVLVVACGVLGPLVPSALALYRYNGGGGPAWLDALPDVALLVNAVIFAVAGPWTFYRAGRALRPSVGTSWVHTLRGVVAAMGMAYGAMAMVLLGTAIVGTFTLGALLGLPMTFHVLLLPVFGPLALAAGVASLLATGMDACAADRHHSGSAWGHAYS